MNNITVEYLILVFVAACGTIQVAATRANLISLLFIKRPLLNYLLGIVLIAGAFYWFFHAGNRNLPGVQGSEQFGNFFFTATGAVLFTLVASSLKRWGSDHRVCSADDCDPEPAEGLEALKQRSYLSALTSSFRKKNSNGSR